MMREVYAPEQPFISDLELKAEFDQLFLQKCEEVNKLEREVEKFKRMAEIAVKQKAELREQLEEAREQIESLKRTIRIMDGEPLTGDLISREEAINEIQAAFEGFVIFPVNMQNYDVDYIKNQYNGKITKVMDAVRSIPAASSADMIEALAAKQLPFGFIPDVELPEELPEELAEGVPLWAYQETTSQDILCLSSALKNLHDIHKCDSFILYTKLSRVLEKLIDDYSKEEG